MSDDNYIREKYRALSYSYEQFDKNVLFIASGALGISFGFIEKLVPDLAATVHKSYLIGSWYCFAGVIFISLLAHFIAIQVIRSSIEHDDDKTGKNDKISRRRNYIIRALNSLMIAGLLLGIILLITFVDQNL